jgi:hypothetical protein
MKGIINYDLQRDLQETYLDNLSRYIEEISRGMLFSNHNIGKVRANKIKKIFNLF